MWPPKKCSEKNVPTERTNESGPEWSGLAGQRRVGVLTESLRMYRT